MKSLAVSFLSFLIIALATDFVTSQGPGAGMGEIKGGIGGGPSGAGANMQAGVSGDTLNGGVNGMKEKASPPLRTKRSASQSNPSDYGEYYTSENIQPIDDSSKRSRRHTAIIVPSETKYSDGFRPHNRRAALQHYGTMQKTINEKVVFLMRPRRDAANSREQIQLEDVNTDGSNDSAEERGENDTRQRRTAVYDREFNSQVTFLSKRFPIVAISQQGTIENVYGHIEA